MRVCISPQVVMFTSDVSARGVDYPDVSLVVQVCTLLALVQDVSGHGATWVCRPQRTSRHHDAPFSISSV